MTRKAEFQVKDDFIEVHFLGESKTPEEQIELSESFLKGLDDIFKKHPKRSFKLLFNVGERKSVPSDLDKKALRNYESVIKSKNLSKLAVLGDSKIAEIVVTIIFFRLKGRKVNWFSDRKRALKWLGVEPSSEKP